MGRPKARRCGRPGRHLCGAVWVFATARIATKPVPKKGWPNRYGSTLRAVRLIKPAVSRRAIQQHLPNLAWAVYPRSITTPAGRLAKHVRRLIEDRRRTGLPDLDANAVNGANIDELRVIALLEARPKSLGKSAKTVYRARSRAIRLYALRRAEGTCEACRAPAPFHTKEGTPYLEPHHITRLADDGPDHPARVAALCPNCHRRAHHAEDAEMFNRMLRKRVARLERRLAPR